MQALHGTDFTPPSSLHVFLWLLLALPPPIVLSFFFLSLPNNTQQTHAAQSTQVISLQTGVQLVSETHQDGEQK